ncbi:heme oxygenase (biliverdin-producing) [Arthrobacter sp. 31Y]|uniref:biliverdin-producing heme oxygenase n=1 Tax=Arthrobacter sp. 31Y TaxID=1115632 RepID=UPI0004B08610|nr:biliverdin-producing heme oxygenase [Arthrobacter sp. 31Y]
MTAFSEELKSHTASAHEHAEQAGFVTELLNGKMEASQVAAMLVQNYVIYQALESALDANPDPRLAPFADPALMRVEALEKDLAVHYGEDWERRLAAGELHVTPGAKAYADELAAIGPGSTTYLMAHHYVRYLGDLSGGQIISALVQRHYDLGPEGLNFYAFEGIGKIKPYKDSYRSHLDEADFSDVEKQEILHHAEVAFETNRQVFVDLMEHYLKLDRGLHVVEQGVELPVVVNQRS